jgi:nucleoside-diphosphate-sugar epimerase
MMMSKKHVVFGSGPVGMAVMEALLAKGNQVRMVNTRGFADVPDGVSVIAANAYSVEDTTEATRDASVVYQCAAPLYTDWAEKFIPLQTAILEGAARNNCPVVIADNLYMYGDVNCPIHEQLPNSATTRKGIIRAALAEAALNLHQSGKLRVAIARGSDFFGPHVKNALIGARAIQPALKGKTAQLMGNLDVPHSFTYIKDFGQALATLGEHEDAYGQIWHVPNNAPLTQRELMIQLFAAINKPAKMASMSNTMMTVIGLFVSALRESREMMYAIEKPYIVDSAKFEARFNIYATPLDVAIHETLSWYRQH